MSAKSVTIIDRYLIRQFLQLFAMSYVSLAGLYTVVDAFTNLDSFIHYAEQEGNLAWVMLRFYAFRWLTFFDLTSGVLALVAATFTITLFQSRNEMTSLLAAGIAKRRICMPVIGAAAVMLMAFEGRIAGISGILSRLLPPAPERPAAGRVAFVAGLIAAPILTFAFTGAWPVPQIASGLPVLIVAGLLVGFGSVWGNGCTSGHGICGLSRFSLRSAIAVAVFMTTAIATVFVVRHIL